MITARLPYTFLSQFSALTWQDIEFGFSHNLISASVAIEFANARVARIRDVNPLEIKIASSSTNDSILEDLKTLAKHESAISDTKKKWLFFLVAWTYQNRNLFADPLAEIEAIYLDFDYPEEIAPLIRYMPSKDPDLGRRELNEERLIKRWGEFVEKGLTLTNS